MCVPCHGLNMWPNSKGWIGSKLSHIGLKLDATLDKHGQETTKMCT